MHLCLYESAVNWRLLAWRNVIHLYIASPWPYYVFILVRDGTNYCQYQPPIINSACCQHKHGHVKSPVRSMTSLALWDFLQMLPLHLLWNVSFTPKFHCADVFVTLCSCIASSVIPSKQRLEKLPLCDGQWRFFNTYMHTSDTSYMLGMWSMQYAYRLLIELQHVKLVSRHSL